VDKIERVFRDLGITELADVGAIYSKMYGANLFKGALRLFPPSASGLRSAHQKAMPNQCYSLEPGVVPVAKAIGGVLWGLLPNGRVRGYGEGIVYGPDAPFAAWFGDQVIDLEYAWDHARDTIWGIGALGL
jgi:hypothetical protein